MDIWQREHTLARTTVAEPPAEELNRRRFSSSGGRPTAFDPELYKLRNTVERGFNRIKHWRGIATRYDKYALTYQGGLLLAILVTTHRLRS